MKTYLEDKIVGMWLSPVKWVYLLGKRFNIQFVSFSVIGLYVLATLMPVAVVIFIVCMIELATDFNM